MVQFGFKATSQLVSQHKSTSISGVTPETILIGFRGKSAVLEKIAKTIFEGDNRAISNTGFIHGLI